jgi:hypothetical protein
MGDIPSIQEFPAAADCIRHTFDALSAQNEERARNNGSTLLFAAQQAAGDIREIDDTIDTMYPIRETSDNKTLERACAGAAYKCGIAIGLGQCARWRYDREERQIVARQSLDEQNSQA